MKTFEINSSALKTVKYDEIKKQLFITFVSGREYRFDNVPAEVMDKFELAESKGKFYNTEIKNKYTWSEV